MDGAFTWKPASRSTPAICVAGAIVPSIRGTSISRSRTSRSASDNWRSTIATWQRTGNTDFDRSDKADSDDVRSLASVLGLASSAPDDPRSGDEFGK